MKYKLMKVFDCTNMPQDVSSKFMSDSEASNDCYLDRYCHGAWNYKSEHKGGEILAEEDDMIIEKGIDIVSDWLYDNGAELGEEVIIKHWW